MRDPHTHQCRLCSRWVDCDAPDCRQTCLHCNECENGLAEVDALSRPVRTIDDALELLEGASRRGYRRSRADHSLALRLLSEELEALAPADPLDDSALAWVRRGAVDGARAAFAGHGQAPKHETLPSVNIQHCYNAAFATAALIGLTVRNQETKA